MLRGIDLLETRRKALPVSAVMRRVPAATLSSASTLNRPTWLVLSRCVPPHNSLLNSPIETIRTMSGYFSPTSIIATLAVAPSMNGCEPSMSSSATRCARN